MAAPKGRELLFLLALPGFLGTASGGLGSG